MRDNPIAPVLLSWYDRNARAMPWRIPPQDKTPQDPYRTWLSEVMLQQTTVAAVRAYFRRFTERWLRLDKLGSMPPPGGFYFHRQMEPQMLRQTDAYFADLVSRNGPVRDIIDSDYTFLNERMAQSKIVEVEINDTRNMYLDVAIRGSILYFVIADLAGIDPMY